MYLKIDIIRFFKEYYGNNFKIPEIKNDVLTEGEIRALFFVIHFKDVITNDISDSNKQFYTRISNNAFNTFEVWLEENNINQSSETIEKT